MPLFFVYWTFNLDTTKMNYIFTVTLLKLTRVRLKLHHSIAPSFLARVLTFITFNSLHRVLYFWVEISPSVTMKRVFWYYSFFHAAVSSRTRFRSMILSPLGLTRQPGVNKSSFLEVGSHVPHNADHCSLSLACFYIHRVELSCPCKINRIELR